MCRFRFSYLRKNMVCNNVRGEEEECEEKGLFTHVVPIVSRLVTSVRLTNIYYHCPIFSKIKCKRLMHKILEIIYQSFLVVTVELDMKSKFDYTHLHIVYLSIITIRLYTTSHI